MNTMLRPLLCALASAFCMTASAVEVSAEPPSRLASFFGLARPALNVVTDHHAVLQIHIDERGLPMEQGRYIPYATDGDCLRAQKAEIDVGLVTPCTAQKHVVFDGIRARRLDANFCEIVETTLLDIKLERVKGQLNTVPVATQREWKVPCGYDHKTKYASTVSPVTVDPLPTPAGPAPIADPDILVEKVAPPGVDPGPR